MAYQTQSQPVNTHYSIEAEQAVLGGLLLDNEKWDEVSQILAPSNFYVHAHQQIFSTIQAMCEANSPVDVLILERKLAEKAILEEVGGLAYLAELSKNTPSVANITTYAEIVRRDSQARELFALGQHLRTEAVKVNSQTSLDTLLEHTERRLTDLAFNHQQQESIVSLPDVLAQVIQQMNSSCEKNMVTTGTAFGIERLDRSTSGAQNGELIILAARPSMGKTALSLTFAESALESQPEKPIQYYSLEMPAEQILQRFLSMRSQVAINKIRQPTEMSDEDWARFSEAFNYIHSHWNNRLLIDDSSYLSPQSLRIRARRNARKYGEPSVIIVDYLQLMSVPEQKNSNNRNLEIAEISRSLKALAKEMNCPVIALSQLNRNLELRSDKRPMPSDLRDSGSLEQDADLLLFIYRDEVYNKNTDLPGIAEILIGKQRNGPTGTVLTQFKGEFGLFANIPDDEYEKLARSA